MLLRGRTAAGGREAARRSCTCLKLISLQRDVALFEDMLQGMLGLLFGLILGAIPDWEDNLQDLRWQGLSEQWQIAHQKTAKAGAFA